MKISRIGNKIILFGLALSLVLPLVKINLVPGKISESENRVLANFPDIIDENGEITDNLLPQLKNWFNDNIGLRSEFVTLNGLLQYHILNRSPSESVELGKEGWMYYTLDNNLDIARGTYPNFGVDILQITCEKQIRIQEKLAEKGVEYVLVLPSSKVSIYPEYIASGDYQIRETPSDILAEYMKENSAVNVIKLKDARLEEKENAQIYFKTDTHWNDWGAYTGYKEIITQMNQLGLCDSSIAEVSVSKGTYKGEFSAMMGNKDILPEEVCPETEVVDPSAQDISDSTVATQIEAYLQNQGIYNPFYMYENPDQADKPSVLLFGDSLFAYWSMPELFAESFSRFCYVWNFYEIDENIIEMFEPDIVICTIGERYLNQLYTKSSSITVNPVENANAEVLSCDINGSEIRVEVRNTSDSTWSFYDNVKLGVWEEDVDTGYRIELPIDTQVAPGSTVVFYDDEFPFLDFEDGKYNLQMLQEGIQYFGELYPEEQDNSFDAEIVSHDAPETVTHTDSYTFDVTVKNTGESPWSESDQIRLCVWQDGSDLGYRLYLPDGVTVSAGEEYTFTLEGFVLPEAEQTILEFQMLQEGVQYFGEREPVVIIASQ